MTDTGLRGTPAPTPIADLTPENLRALIEDMGGKPGWYLAADLYRWYVGLAEEDGLTPVARNKFGEQLRDLGYKSSRRRFNGVIARCWFITRRAVR